MRPPNNRGIHLPDGSQVQQVPVISWAGVLTAPVVVDGKVTPARLNLEHPMTLDDMLQILLFFTVRKPGVVAWDTIPEEVRIHLKIVANQSASEPEA